MGGSLSAMRVSHFEQEHLLILDQDEAQCLADACALLICASSYVEGCNLPPHTGHVLAGVFSALTQPCRES